MKCLDDNRVCGKCLKCEVCIFDDCRKTLEVLEMREKQMEDMRLKRIKRQLHELCEDCSMLQILNADKELLYCPYLVNRECLIASVVMRQGSDDNNE